jgi:hypothetical protein
MPLGTRLLLLSTTCVLQHWVDGAVLETVWSEPGVSLADLRDDYNAEVPKHAWEKNLDGSERAPWSISHVGYFIDEVSGEKFTFANGTVGARIAIETVTDRVETIRKLRGEVIPVVALVNKQMKTKFGTKLRPRIPDC